MMDEPKTKVEKSVELIFQCQELKAREKMIVVVCWRVAC
jgi:hypothetical protein